MIELIDARNQNTLGYRYSETERNAALFSVAMSRQGVMRGLVTADPFEALQADVRADEVTALLQDEQGFMTPDAHGMCVDAYLLVPQAIHGSVPTRQLPAVCELLGIDHDELVEHAPVAKAMCDPAQLVREFL